MRRIDKINALIAKKNECYANAEWASYMLKRAIARNDEFSSNLYLEQWKAFFFAASKFNHRLKRRFGIQSFLLIEREPLTF